MHIYGRNAVVEALAAGKEVEKIFISFGMEGDVLDRIRGLARKNGVPCVTMDKRKFQQLEREICDERNAQGVIALVLPFKTLDVPTLIENVYAESEKPLIVVLDGITDPHNLGAIARSAECAGAQGLILPERNSAPIGSIAIKASAGALEYLPVAKAGNLAQALEDLKNADFWILGTDDSAKQEYTSALYDRPIALVIGSEGEGMRRLTRDRCDELISIPLKGKISSLNASVAAGVVLFEIARQRSAQ